LIEKYLDHTVFDYSISYTQYSGHATELAKEAVEKGYHAVVAVGGDGSINEVATSLLYTDTVLGIMPFGSGNGLSRHLGISRNVKKALRIINSYRIMKIDAGEYAPGKYFFSNVGIGFAVHVVKWFEHHKVRGFLSYAIAVVRGFTYNNSTRLKLMVNNSEIERDVIIFNVCNSNQYGYGVGLAPEAKLDDGMLDIVVIRKFTRLLMPVFALLILMKKQNWIPQYELYSSSACTVLNEENKYWVLQVDGELCRFKENWNVKVLPKALNVLVP